LICLYSVSFDIIICLYVIVVKFYDCCIFVSLPLAMVKIQYNVIYTKSK